MMEEFSNLPVFITGATGFIGSHLTQRLVDAGVSVRVLVRDPARLPASIRSHCEVMVGDLGDTEILCQGLNGVGTVFHCAANVNTWDSWEAYEQVNVSGVQSLLDAILASSKRQKIRLVHISTVDVYGFPHKACDETFLASGGAFGYGRSKWQGEKLVRDVCDKADIPYTVIRPANVIGPGSQFISRIGVELKSGLMLLVDGGRENAGILYVTNLIDYMLWAAQSEKAIGQCYNVRDDYDVTWREFVRVFRQAVHGRGLVISLPFAVANAVAWIFDRFHRLVLPGREPLLHPLLVRLFGRTCGHSADKIRNDSGMTGKVKFAEAMDKSVHWFLSQTGGW